MHPCTRRNDVDIKIFVNTSAVERSSPRVLHKSLETTWWRDIVCCCTSRTHTKIKLESVCVCVMCLPCVCLLFCCFLDSVCRHVTSWPTLDLFISNHLIWWATFCQNTVSLTVVCSLCFSLYCQGGTKINTQTEELVLRETIEMNGHFVLRCAVGKKTISDVLIYSCRWSVGNWWIASEIVTLGELRACLLVLVEIFSSFTIEKEMICGRNHFA